MDFGSPPILRVGIIGQHVVEAEVDASQLSESTLYHFGEDVTTEGDVVTLHDPDRGHTLVVWTTQPEDVLFRAMPL